MSIVLRSLLYRNAVYIMLANLAMAGTGFLFWIVAARLYPAQSLGEAAAAVSAMTLLALLTTLGLDVAIVRFLPEAGEAARDTINSCLTIEGLLSAACSLIFLLGIKLWSPALVSLQKDYFLFAVFVISVPALNMSTLTQQVFVASRRANFALHSGLIFGFSRFLPLAALTAFLSSSGVFTSWVLALILTFCIGIFVFMPRVHPGYRPTFTIRLDTLRKMVGFSLANYVVNVFWYLPSLVLPILVINLLGAEANAYFYIAWSIEIVLLLIPTAVSTSLLAEGSYDQERLAHGIRISFKLLAFIISGAVLAVLLLADKLLFLFGKEYSTNAAQLLRLLALSSIPAAINSIYIASKRVQMKTTGAIAMTAFVATCTIMLSYFLLQSVGILGAGIAFLVAQTLGVVVLGSRIVTKNTSKTPKSRDQGGEPVE